ncbi:hypothetical protein [Nonomuraea sp. NPDC049784]|uniref:hypothetical protein n=1 Tax=Nonomuraea sp. NPDC049784 TaxID=3154361 RepID=UPI0033F3907E
MKETMGIPTPGSGGEEHTRVPPTTDEHSRHEYPDDGERSHGYPDDDERSHDYPNDDERSHGDELAGDDSPRAAADDELEARSPRADDEYAAAVPGAVTAPEAEHDAPYRDPYAATGGDMLADQEQEPVASDEAPAHAAPEDVVLFDQDPDQVQARWRDLQTSFVDDPGEAVRRADGLVGEVVESLTSSLTSRTDTLRARWKDADASDTEQLRLALRDYRSVLESLLTLSETRR